MCTVKECSQTSCPFAHSEESEIAQSYGCLPSSYDIIKMKAVHGKTWACHSDPTKPCLGAIEHFKSVGLIFKTDDKPLVTLDDHWEMYC